MSNTPGNLLFPSALDDVSSLVQARNNAVTSLTVSVSSSNTSLDVVDTASFPDTGLLTIDGEVISYTAKSGTQLTGCERGRDQTTAAAHSIGAPVEGLITALHHNILAQGLVAVENKLGRANSVATKGAILQGTGVGSSEWIIPLSYAEVSLTGAGSGIVLSPEQYRAPWIILMGTLAADMTVEFPDIHRIWTVQDTTIRGGHKIFIRKDGGAGRELYAGEIADFRASGS